MIISNILGDQVISDKAGQFYKVADSTEEYAEMIEPICLKGDGRGGSDHFISTIRSINSLWKTYSYYGIDDTLEKIKETPSLLMWFSMVVTVMLYGCNTGNSFSPVNLSFSGNRPYLRVWKDKLSISDQYDNCIGNENILEDGLNVYYFDTNSNGSVAGCCSRRFFIIPSREVIRKDGENSPWKDFYHKLIDVPGDLNKNLFVKTSHLQKILLLLSARSLPDESPLKMIKDIIFAYINIPLRGFDELPAKEFGNISLYCVDQNYIPLSMFSEKIYFVYSNEFLNALYPFNSAVLEEIEKGKCIVKSISMNVSESAELESEESRIDMAVVTGSFVYNITFTSPNGKNVSVPYHFTETHDFSARSIWYLSHLPTFCMYPDVPFEYESMCHEYTFFSNRAAMLKSFDDITDFNNCVKLSEEGIDCFAEINNSSLEISNGNLYTFDVSTVEKPRHLIKVIWNKMYLGTVVNVRRKDGETCPVLLDQNVKAEINLANIDNSTDVDMSVYVDFGSQTCSMGYKVSNGEPYYDSITGGTPTIRLLLAEYDLKYYSPYMNIFKDSVPHNQAPTYMVSYFDNIVDIEDFTPYHGAFLPFKNSAVEFEQSKLKIYDCDKHVLEKGYQKQQNDLKSESCIKAIIYNLCYTAACHALNKGCNHLYVYPSIPGKLYVEFTAGVWDSVIKSINNVFDIEIINMLHAEKMSVLYDGVVSVAGAIGNAIDTLFVNVEIGHTLTKLAAVSTDMNGAKKLCAYSSFQFGGKDLLYQCVYDMLSHCESAASAQKLLYGAVGGNSLFVPKQRLKIGSENDPEKIASKLCKKFFPNNKRRGCPRDDSWHNVLAQLLKMVDFNTECDFSTEGIQFCANLIFRYALLIQTVNNFVDMVIKQPDNKNIRRMKIRFDGVAAKGFDFADKIISGDEGFLKKAEVSMRKYLSQCSLEIGDNSNKTYMKSLSEISCVDSRGHRKLAAENDLQESIQATEIPAGNINELFNIKNYKHFRKYCVDAINKYMPNRDMTKMLLGAFKNSDSFDIAIEINEAFSIINGTMQLMCPVSDIYPEMLDSIFCMIEACKLLSKCYGEEFSLL